MQTLIAAIFVFGLLIFAHEFGHYIAARLSGIRVLELAIGFGPKLINRRKNETDYSLRVFPLGGFCRMLGENPEEAKEPGSFLQKPIRHRAAVLAAGSIMNLLLAFIIFFIIFFFLVGTPDESSRIGAVLPDSPAEQMGLQAGDRIIAIDDAPISRWDEVLTSIGTRPDEEVRVVVRRNGEIKEFFAVAEADRQTGRGRIGIFQSASKYDPGGALGASLQQFGLFLGGLYQIVTGQEPLDVTGPLGIVMTVGEAAQTGFVNLLLLTGWISISLAILNLLPIPALDGGRLLFLVIEAIRRRPLDPEKEGFVHFIGFVLLILLIMLVTYNDVLRWFLPDR